MKLLLLRISQIAASCIAVDGIYYAQVVAFNINPNQDRGKYSFSMSVPDSFSCPNIKEKSGLAMQG